MANCLDRFNALVDALLDPVVLSNARRLEIGDAYVWEATEANIAQALAANGLPAAPLLGSGLIDRASLSNNQRAAVVLWRHLYDAKQVRRRYATVPVQATLDASLATAIAQADATFT